MKILALEIETPQLAKEALSPQLLKEEAQRVWELYRGGTIREIYFRDDAQKAVLILECRDEQEAKLHLDTLPLVRDGLIQFELINLVPYPGFERLFV